jgi:predicted 3-demethylubiquinone-9 3-methyltransferase (glyoxalase superfamily)
MQQRITPSLWFDTEAEEAAAYGLEELLADPDPERARHAMQAMLGMDKLDIAALRAAAGGVAAT